MKCLDAFCRHAAEVEAAEPALDVAHRESATVARAAARRHDGVRLERAADPDRPSAHATGVDEDVDRCDDPVPELRISGGELLTDFDRPAPEGGVVPRRPVREREEKAGSQSDDTRERSDLETAGGALRHRGIS